MFSTNSVARRLGLSFYSRSTQSGAALLLSKRFLTISANNYMNSNTSTSPNTNSCALFFTSPLSSAGPAARATILTPRRHYTLPTRPLQQQGRASIPRMPGDMDDSGDSSARRRPTEEEVRQRMKQGEPIGSGSGGAESANQEALGYDPYAVLGLKKGASPHSVRLRYHELMKQVHPDMVEAADDESGAAKGDIPRLNQINKAYELIMKSPTLDKRYRNLVSDTQHFYYRFLPEWMARNVDEMPRYWSWVKWRTPSAFHVFLLLFACYALGRFAAAFPVLTTVFCISVGLDILLHTMLAPAALSMLFLYSIMAYRSYDMAWLTSPRGFLRRELGY